MTVEQALHLADEYHKIGDQLKEHYPCRACQGDGESDSVHSDGMPMPCGECWGRGWTID